MLKRHEIEILLKAGHRKTEVARLTGVSLCSVKRIAQEGPVMQVDDAAERAQRQVSRPTNSVRLKVQFPDCRQTGQNRRIVCNVFTRAIMARSDGPYPWHETWPL
jgi:hypothetical protein